MPNATQFAAALSRAVARLQESSEGGEPQKHALRALVATAGQRSATIRFYDGQMTLDETPLDITLPSFQFLAECLKAHAVQEIVIGRGADAAELLALVRGLADTSGHGRIKERLRDAASTRVMVIVEQRDPGRRAPSVTQAFAKAALDEVVMDEWNKFLAQGNSNQRAFAMPGVPEAETPPPALPPVEKRQTVAPIRPVSSEHAVRADGAATPGAPRLTVGLESMSPLGIAIAEIQGAPYERDILARLTRAGKLIEESLSKDRVPEAIDALAELIRLEAAAPTEQARGPYGVVLKRTLSRSVLTIIAPFLLDPRRGARTTVILRRGSDESLDLLLGLLVAAPTLAERVAYGQVVRSMSSGPARLLRLLARQEWQVVRTVAEVVGELLLEDGVSYLARLLEHEDQRVRRAALVAVARIGSPNAVELVRQLLASGAPELRALVAGSIGGAHARAMVAPLMAATEKEDRAELVKVYCLALGRIGTDEAVQALASLAEPGGLLLGRRPTSTRLAAIEGLKLAGARAADVLSRLADAGDRAVAPAAQAARNSLEQLPATPR